MFGFSLSGSKSKNKWNETEVGSERFDQMESGEEYGEYGDSETGSFDNTDAFDNTDSVNTRQWWEQGLEGAAGNWSNFSAPYLQPGGHMNAGQQQGYDTLARLNSGANPALTGIYAGRDATTGALREGQDFMKYINTDLLDPLIHRKAPEITAAKIGIGQDVEAATGADFMGLYADPWEADVVGTSLADYDEGVARAANEFRAANIAGGTTGGAGVSNPVGASILAGEAARGRGALAAGLRSEGFRFGAGQGAGDASRTLQAAQGNQGTRLQRDVTRAELEQDAERFNVQSKLSNDQMRLQGIDAATRNALSYTDMGAEAGRTLSAAGIAANDVEAQSALNQMTAAGIPLEQAIAVYQSGQWPYTTATAGFGSTSRGTQTSRGNQTGSKSGTTRGSTSGTRSGTGSTYGNRSGTSSGTTFGFSGGYKK